MSGASRGGLVQQASPGPPPQPGPRPRCSGKAIPVPGVSLALSLPAALLAGPGSPCGSHHSPRRPRAPRDPPRPGKEKKNPPHAGSPPCQHGSHADGACPWGHTPRQTCGPRDGGSAAARARSWGRPRAGPARRARSLLQPPNLACSRAVLVGPAAAATFRGGRSGKAPSGFEVPPRTGSLPDGLLHPLCFLSIFLSLSPSCGNHHLRKLSLSVSPPPLLFFPFPHCLYPGAACLKSVRAGPLGCQGERGPEPGVPEEPPRSAWSAGQLLCPA